MVTEVEDEPGRRDARRDLCADFIMESSSEQPSLGELSFALLRGTST